MNAKEITQFKVVIPARYGSTRLPGKPLKIIAGKTMVRRVCDNAKAAGASTVIVATDDQRIVDEIVDHNGTAMMTSSTHRTGTDRIAEVAQKEKWDDNTIVVNLQGDEPGIPPEMIQQVALALKNSPTAGISTLATPIRNTSDLFNPNVVKVVITDSNMAMYFSRAPIPYCRDSFPTTAQPPSRLPEDTTFLRHLGLYAYRVGALNRIAAHAATSIEKAESLEQLRAMSMDIGIYVSVIDTAPGHGVDTEEDLARMESVISEPQINE